VLDDPSFVELSQRCDRATRRHCCRKTNMFRVMQITNLEVISAQKAQTALDTAAHLVSCELTRLQVAISFGRQDEAWG
jgi:hypothetical protein